MSWDIENVDFSSGNVDFSSGNVEFTTGNMDFSTGNRGNSTGVSHLSSSSKDCSLGLDHVSNHYKNETNNNNNNQLDVKTPSTNNNNKSYKWASNRARYEYNENTVDQDGMAARNEELEKELFGDVETTGLDFSKYSSIPVRVERGIAPTPIKNFDEADLHPVIKENVKLSHYIDPTPVQMYSIPIITIGKDLMACAQTGSGKTAAFLVPTLSALFYHSKQVQKPRPTPYELKRYKAEPLILIIVPTRELCSQIFDECRKFTYRSSLRPCAVYGGADTFGQIRQLERGCDVLVASPGRLMDFIQRGKVGLNCIKYLVLDEADRMLDMGFEAIIRNIIEKNGMNRDRQTLLFSATFPRTIRALARDFLKPDYLFLKVGRVGGTSTLINQNVLYVDENEKREKIYDLLNSTPPTRTLIFVETKRSADSLDNYLYEHSFPTTSIHGDRTQMEREDALLAFKHGKCPILVATAVAARGIDIRNVMHVINYDMPKDMDEYIHRIGRTARVGKSGLATSFYNDRSDDLAPELVKLLNECNQVIPDFLQNYVTEDTIFDEDLDDDGVQAPSYAGQEYVAPERPFAINNNCHADSFVLKSTLSNEDWDCPECQTSNYASRQKCFKCSATRPGSESHTKREGDWDCPSCQTSNYASRQECFKCHASKDNDSQNDSPALWNTNGPETDENIKGNQSIDMEGWGTSASLNNQDTGELDTENGGWGSNFNTRSGGW